LALTANGSNRRSGLQVELVTPGRRMGAVVGRAARMCGQVGHELDDLAPNRQRETVDVANASGRRTRERLSSSG
jgi:hypothetical protein